MRLYCHPFTLILMVSLIMGCQSAGTYSGRPSRIQKPAITIMSLENRSRVPAAWQIGDGIADQLAKRLMETRRFDVVDRKRMPVSQTSGRLFGRTPSPTEITATATTKPNYIVSGLITDFGISNAPGGIFDKIDEGLFGKDSKHIVSVELVVTDTATGQIAGRFTAEGRVTTSSQKARVPYETIGFGGYGFFQTPLGQATDKMLNDAVRQIGLAIPEKPYELTIASIVNNQIIINAGRDIQIAPGMEFIVRPAPETITDPVSGRTIGQYSQQPIGRIRITQVTQKFAIAIAVEPGPFEVGQRLEEIKTGVKTPNNLSFSDY